MKCLTILLLSMVLWTSSWAQDLKAAAEKAFVAEDYVEAVRILEKAIAANPDDPEAWYLLGHALHLLSYDSVPLPGYAESTSDRTLACLKKAVSLQPRNGDAFGILGSEYGARAVNALQAGRLQDFTAQLQLGRDAGGYADWMVEYAQNMLNSCDSNAVLLVGGDAEAFPGWYCQFLRGIRTDVTVVPISLLDRAWFVLLLKSGVHGLIQPMPISWSKEQILDLHPSKWTKRQIDLLVPNEVQQRFGSRDSLLAWDLDSDLNRGGRPFLSTNLAFLHDLLKSNSWIRPVQFSLGCHRWMLANLDDHLQIRGITRQLVPFSVKDSGRGVNIQGTIDLFSNPRNFNRLPTLKERDNTGYSAILQNYRVVCLRACEGLLKSSNQSEVLRLLNFMNANLPESIIPISPGLKSAIDDILDRATNKH
jgi:tetratricopeptide (TPR) repeat protein